MASNSGKMNDELVTMADAELSRTFAMEIAGWAHHPQHQAIWHDELDRNVDQPRFSTDANAVLPWLEKWLYVDIHRDEDFAVGPWAVAISREREYTPLFNGHGKTFARAACIALIRSKRGAK